jgi:hypothetical protein
MAETAAVETVLREVHFVSELDFKAALSVS